MIKNLLILVILSGCSYSENIRPHLEGIIGKDLANAILGPLPEEVAKEIVLPPIPKVDRDATSVKGYSNEEIINKNKIPQDRIKELNVHFIRELYQEVKGVEVDQKSLSQWINVLSQGGSREGVYRALVNDVEFFKLEETKAPLTDRTIEFVSYYSKLYLNMEYSKETLDEVNFYLLKSDLTDRTLEVMDSFSGRYNELYDWYAVFSSDIAIKYSNIFKFETRKNISKEFHREWAANVPVQMVKSEVIIKMQKILNSLNK